MTAWFTADTHFGSERTLKLSRRPFPNTGRMDGEILNQWAQAFCRGDILYHLGDFGDMEMPMEFLRNRGIICHLVLGNYEEDAIAQKTLSEQELLNIGFASVSRKLYIPELPGVKLVHRPVDCDKSVFNVFGHIHGRQTVKRYGLDVGVDAHHFRPISLEDVLWYKNAIENHYDENVFE